MTLGKAFRLASAWFVLSITAIILALYFCAAPLQAQGSRIAWIFDGFGNGITSSLEGSLRGLHVVIVDPATNANLAYVTEDHDTGTDGASTLRTTEASDSPITTSTASAVTALQLIDDDQTGGTDCPILATASTNATSCKGSAGRVLGIYVLNTTTTTYYLRMYRTAAAPTCSSATGFAQSYPIPPASSAGQVGGFAFPFPPAGLASATGIGYCITGGSTSTDNTNAAAGIFGTIVYK